MTIKQLQELLDNFDENKSVFIDRDGSVYVPITHLTEREIWVNGKRVCAITLNYNPLMCI